MKLFTLEQFAAHLNETFMVSIEGDGRAPYVLVEARPMSKDERLMPGMMRAPFSLLFRNESAIVFPQKTYTMTHQALGEFGIFLVPIARDKQGFIYQALFN
ncbi:DUF6916 family protein [Dyella silvae]|uniref:DUF6916 family protein n=1 Tax=Dyella silvae TaxID=2994424 RepID=UPI002264A668|nr:hypothetical protein [Dyella silvae]